jgi:hypothetical protein
MNGIEVLPGRPVGGENYKILLNPAAFLTGLTVDRRWVAPSMPGARSSIR